MNSIFSAKYADARIDMVFKKCFGSEQHKAATIGLINSMIPGVNITDVTFESTELQGLSTEDRKGIIDVLCTCGDGSSFIVEMQRAGHACFRERTLYYSSLYMLSQARRGEWDFHLKSSYVIAFVDFPLWKMGVTPRDGDVPMVSYKTTDVRTNEKMPGSTEFYFFDLSSFVKKEEEIVGNQEKWLFLLRNSSSLTERPKNITGPEFDEFFRAAAIARFDDKERIQYEKDMVTELDRKLSLQYARQEGRAEGKTEEQLRIAREFKTAGVALSIIAQATGLTLNEIENL